MTRRRLLDLFSGAGGAGMGYHRAGFDVTGVDISPQPRYPFEFIQADALEVLADPAFLARFDAIHASPVCKGYSVSSLSHRVRGRTYPDQIGPARDLLEASGLPWVIENVPRAPLRPDYRLCGCMFGLRSRHHQLIRERWFETSWHGFDLRPGCWHPGPPVTVAGHGQPSWTRAHGEHPVTVQDWRQAMGIGWMTRDELAQAIPPAYTEWVGERLLGHLAGREAA